MQLTSSLSVTDRITALTLKSWHEPDGGWRTFLERQAAGPGPPRGVLLNTSFRIRQLDPLLYWSWHLVTQGISVLDIRSFQLSGPSVFRQAWNTFNPSLPADQDVVDTFR